MAHLNLRDRVIETTIAYVGVDGSGGTNIAHVKKDHQRGQAGSLGETSVDGGRILTLDWRPRDGAKLNDCEIAVKLVSTEGLPDGDAMQRVLVDADGMVLMLESDPSAGERNQRAAATVRAALARSPQKRVPVVVQVDQRDGADATDASGDLVALVAKEWPSVAACTTKGVGVMETLKRAVDAVVESMQRPNDAEPAPLRTSGAPRTEGNPLLGALRQIMQATVTEQMTALEKRLVEQIDTRLGSQLDARPTSERSASRADVERLTTRVIAESNAQRETVDERVAQLSASMDRLLVEANAQREAVAGVLAALEEARKAVQHAETEVGERVAEMRESMQMFGHQADGRVDAVHAEIAALVEELRSKRKGWFS